MCHKKVTDIKIMDMWKGQSIGFNDNSYIGPG